jgi:hypothetical protein
MYSINTSSPVPAMSAAPRRFVAVHRRLVAVVDARIVYARRRNRRCTARTSCIAVAAVRRHREVKGTATAQCDLGSFRVRV